EFDLELVKLELLLHGIHDAKADVDREAYRFLVIVEIGKRDGRVAIADDDGAALLDLLECPGELLCIGLRGTEGGGHHQAHHRQALHSSLLGWIVAVPRTQINARIGPQQRNGVSACYAIGPSTQMKSGHLPVNGRTLLHSPHPGSGACAASRRTKARLRPHGSPGDAKHRPETPALRAPHHEGLTSLLVRIRV